MKVTLGKPASANPATKGTCAHDWEEVFSAGGKLLGWHCKRTGACGQHRRLRVCKHCKADFGKECKPDSDATLCENCYSVHKAMYGVDTTAKKSHGKSKGGDNR